MKLRLRRHETRETLKLELADSSTLHDLRQRINASSPSSVHLSLNRKDELLAPSPEDTLRSLGVTSGDLIYYSLDHSAFVASVQEIESASSGETHQPLVTIGESSEGKSGESATLGPQSERGIGFAEVDGVSDVDMNIRDESNIDLNPGVEDSAEGSTGPDPMDVELEQLDLELDAAGNRRLSVPFFLKKILLEKSGDSSELTTLALSIHAVMLESGFVMLNHGSDKFSFSKELLSTSLKYTLPELITRNTIESVTVRFQSLGRMVVVYGILGGSSRMIRLDKQRFVPVIDLVLDTLKFEKQSSCSEYRELFTFWRMVKDGLVMPLLIGLCDESGLELPPCLMRLPTELKLKILESLPASSVAKMCCVCTEMRYVASENDLWKLKCLKEAEHLVVAGGGSSGDSVNWKAKFAAFRMQQAKDAALRMERQRLRQLSRDRRNFQNLHMRGSRSRYPAIFQDDPPFNFLGDRSIGILRGPPARGLGGGGRGRFRCILGGLD